MLIDPFSVKMSSPCTLVEDYRGLLNNPELADVVFRFPQEKNCIYAHRSILVSRCKPFSAMFRAGMKESRKGEIIISNLSFPAFYALLEYLYTGQLFASPSEYLLVLQAADLYQLGHLKKICERKVERFVDTINAAYILQTADKFKAPQLKSFCLLFIAKNMAEVQISEGYQMLEPDLHSEITKTLNNLSTLD
jgi:speckle-type POZ protein